MARSVVWRSARVQASAQKWGTGINSVHSLPYGNEGRNTQVMLTAGGTGTPRQGFAPVDQAITTDGDFYNYLGEEHAEGLWGYSDDSGTSDRPDVGTTTQDFRGSTELMRGSGWPSWGPYDNGQPGGTTIRDRNHGADVSKQSKVQPDEDVAQGWLNKDNQPDVLNASLPEPSQLIMQTSMMQRDQTREGSQRGEGSASEFTQPIRTRLVGMKIRHWSGGERHYDMMPKQQDEVIRPWWTRSAGTASPSYMKANEYVPVEPKTRNPPEDPYAGQDIPSSTASAPSLYGTYGYTGEDVIPFV